MPASVPDRDTDCCPRGCDFELERVRFYLICLRRAEHFGEEFAAVLAHAMSDADGSRRQRIDRPVGYSTRAVNIAVSILQARDVGGLDLYDWQQLERIAAFCCPRALEAPARA